MLTNDEDMEDWFAIYEEEKSNAPRGPGSLSFPKFYEFMERKIEAYDEARTSGATSSGSGGDAGKH